MKTTVKVEKNTLTRIDEAFQSLLEENSGVARKLAKSYASWDFKINAIIDRLKETYARGG